MSKYRKKSHEQLGAQWRNCLRTLSEPEKSSRHGDAETILGELEEEWARRRQVNDWFRWPSTHTQGGDGSLDTTGWHVSGMLRYLGYTVGLNGEPTPFRRMVLAQLFARGLPPVFDRDYLEEWGAKGSAHRLEKLANTIAALTRNAKNRRDNSHAMAISDWESDLEYLYGEYYVKKFNFHWPSAD